MGFDVMHTNLHKTFATPHGGGGPGSGPVAVGERLQPFLPVPRVGCDGDRYFWRTEKECPETIGSLSAFMGNAGILLRAYAYIRLLGRQGLQQVAEVAVVNANYLFKKLQAIGFVAALPERRASHEFVLTLKKLAEEHHVTAGDVAKRLLDFGIHAPTVYFPLLISECLLIEPSETESRAELDRFIEAMAAIWDEAQRDPEKIRTAPHTLPVRRPDDVRAVRELDVRYDFKD